MREYRPKPIPRNGEELAVTPRRHGNAPFRLYPVAASGESKMASLTNYIPLRLLFLGASGPELIIINLPGCGADKRDNNSSHPPPLHLSTTTSSLSLSSSSSSSINVIVEFPRRLLFLLQFCFDYAQPSAAAPKWLPGGRPSSLNCKLQPLAAFHLFLITVLIITAEIV